MIEVFELQMGKTPSRDNPAYWGGTKPWVSIGDMGASKFILSTKENITDQAVIDSGIKLVPKGTVIMSFKLSVGKVAIAAKPLYTNEAIMSFKPRSGFSLSPDYIYYYLKGYKWDGVNRAAMGLTLNKASISQGHFAFPSYSEQERIVAELDLLQGIIDKQKAQLKELDTLAQSIFYDMFGDPVENKKGWVLRKLEEVCNSITDGDHMPPPKAERGIPFITISNIDKVSRTIDFQNTFFVPREYYDKIKYDRIAEKGDLLYTVTGSYGIPVIVKDSKPFCFQRHIALLKPDATIIRTEYLCYWALSASVKQIADDCATGIAQKTVGLNSIRKFPITLPPMDIQNIFATKIEAIERQKASINASIAETQKLFDYTMDKYFG